MFCYCEIKQADSVFQKAKFMLSMYLIYNLSLSSISFRKMRSDLYAEGKLQSSFNGSLDLNVLEISTGRKLLRYNGSYNLNI